MPFVENVTSRGQQVFGRFEPHADTRKFRSKFVMVEGDDDGRYGNLRDITTGGEQIGTGRSGKRLVYTEFKGEDGKPHDINYNGKRLREVVVPIEEARQKERMEANESTENNQDFLDRNELRNRLTDGGYSSVQGNLETTLAESPSIQADPEAGEAVKKSVRGWTPEQRAKITAAKAAKKAATTQTTT